MPIFLHKCIHNLEKYGEEEIFQPGEEVPERLLKDPMVMWYTDSPIYVKPKVGTPEHAAEEQQRRMQKAEDASYQRREEEARRAAEQAAVNEQRAKALAEAAGLKGYAPGALPGAPALAPRTAPPPLRQPLRQPLGPRRASN